MNSKRNLRNTQTLIPLLALLFILGACQGAETNAGNYKKNYTGAPAAATPGENSDDATGDEAGDETAGDEDGAAPEEEEEPAEEAPPPFAGDAMAGAAFMLDANNGCAGCHMNAATNIMDAPGRLRNAETDTAAEVQAIFTAQAAMPFHGPTFPTNDAVIQANIWQACKDNAF